jgi:hypothetical protein
MNTLSIRVDDTISQKFQAASEQEKLRWEDAFNLWWRVYFADDPKQKLDLVVDYFRQKAKERGLTQQKLNEILEDETGRA